MSAEVWSPARGFEGYYEISTLGNVQSLGRVESYRIQGKQEQMTFKGRLLKPCTQSSGYQSVRLSLPMQKPKKMYVHRLVMFAFCGAPAAQQTHVNHKNGNKSDNRLENLEYCTPQENSLHLTRVLKRNIGSENGSSKLNEAQVRAILSDRRTLQEIASDYGVSLQNVWLIQKGEAWGHLLDEGKRLRRLEKRSRG